MKKKNAFTLIELLAIIVILAIIAVITVPIILNIIDNSKKGAVQDSAYGYKDAINKMYVSKLTENPDYSIPNNSYNMSQLKDMGVTVSGQEPDSNSWVQIENNKVLTGCLQFDEYKVNITEGKVGNAEKGTCSPKLAISGDGLYEAQGEPGRYVYRGADPDNRIYLKEDGINNTLYRIVSYEPDGTIKVVRDEKIDLGTDWGMSWDKKELRKSDGTNDTYCTSSNGCNVWGNQTTMLYNGVPLGDNFHYIYYTNSEATTLTNGTSGKVGNQSGKEASLNEYLNGTWLQSTSISNYIANHEFDVGGVYLPYSTKGLTMRKGEEKQLKWIGKIALLSMTEYIEGSTNTDYTNIGSSYVTSNWTLKGDYGQWSLSVDSSSRTSAYYLTLSGQFSSYSAQNWGEVVPAFYLKSSVKLGGLGTSDEPYYIES